MAHLPFSQPGITERAVSPFLELGAYEALWDREHASFKTLADQFASTPDALPSDLVSRATASTYANEVHARLKDAGVSRYGVRVNGAGDYPDRIRDAEHPIELLYYQGWWELVNSPRLIAIVGTRNPTDNGRRRARQLVRSLVRDDFTIVSGLAKGIDSEAHETAISEGGRTIAVLGTPLSQTYPKENRHLQNLIAANHLLISQVPVKRYERQKNPTANRHFFPARNVTMSALTDATVIVEAGETSGTLVQARAALKQGRKLFILESCFNDPRLQWPHKFAEKGAIRVDSYESIREHLLSAPSN